MTELPPNPDHQLAVTGGPVAKAASATLVVPALTANAGARAAKRFLEYFAVTIRNRNTRTAYLHCRPSVLRLVRARAHRPAGRYRAAARRHLYGLVVTSVLKVPI